MKVMIISENRRTLMEISHFFLHSTVYHVDLVHSSPTAMENFMDTRPEFVILDDTTIVPYKTMLQFFHEFSPTCCCLVVGDTVPEDAVQTDSVRYLSKASLNRDLVLDVLEQFRTRTADHTEVVSRELPIQFGDVSVLRLYQDTYCMLMGIYIKRGRPNHEKLHYNIRRIGNEVQKNEALDAILYRDLDVLAVFRRSTHPRTSQILRHMQRLTDIQYREVSCYAVFSMDHVAWNEFEESVGRLCACAPFAYFFPGQMISYDYLQQKHHQVERSVLDFYTEKVLSALLCGQTGEAEKALDHVLYSYIKPNLDLTAASYFRERLWCMGSLLLGDPDGGVPSLEEAAPSLPEEHTRMRAYLSAAAVLLRKRGLSKLTVQAILYILRNKSLDISLSLTAESIPISREHLSHVFKKDMGIPFVGFVQSCKLADAMLQLRYTGQKVYEVANAVGYRDAQYFSRIMKKHTGVSPEQYRQNREGNLYEGLI